MRRSSLASLAASSLLVFACSHEPAPVAPAAAASQPGAPTITGSTASTAIDAPPAPRADGRLTALATPTHYAITLDVDPTRDRFSGRVAIDVDVPRATRFIVLHGHRMDVRDVAATFGSASIAGKATARAAAGEHDPEELVLEFASAIPAGKATIAIDYDAPFAADLWGAYRVHDGGRWYAFTQFESTAARRAFPCFDEPAFKATFDLSITAPSGMIAVANAPETKRSAQGTATRFDFATTPPISSYLVAFAVGDFDVKEGANGPVPIRLISAKGKSAMGDRALASAAEIVRALGDYFGVSYPFAKLDLVAVPDFAAGAMENPGLVTFREELLLQDPAHPNTRARRGADLTIAHELAHQWFGDLVTMQWWNDVWLNEGFATWMEGKIVDELRPQLGLRLDEVGDQQDVMDQDALQNARAVRQPVATTGEIEEAFDGISYEKGAAVLSMIERWVGPATFQRGVRDYVKAHSWKNATAADLLASLDKASGRDVSAMAATFLDRPGVPLVKATPKCDGGKLAVDLAQSAWRPLGVDAKPTDAQPWRVPVCVAVAGAKEPSCTLLDAPSGSLQAPACGAWTYPNAGESAYYRWSLPETQLRALAKSADKLDVASRVGFVRNAWAAVRAGELAPSELLDALPAFDRDADAHVTEAVLTVLHGFDGALVDDDARPAFRAYVAKRIGPRARALGWKAKAGESDADALLRPKVLEMMGMVARDPATLKQADALSKAWLADPTSVDADVAPVALQLGAIGAGPERLDALRAAAKRAKTPLDRIAALSAFTAFDDASTVRRALDATIGDEVKMQDFRYVLGRGPDSAWARPATSRVLFDWITTNWGAIAKKLPGHLAGRMVAVVRGACSKDQRDAEVAFFTPKLRELDGATRPLAEYAETATSCSELRAHGAESVAKYFAKGPKKG